MPSFIAKNNNSNKRLVRLKTRLNKTNPINNLLISPHKKKEPRN